MILFYFRLLSGEFFNFDLAKKSKHFREKSTRDQKALAFVTISTKTHNVDYLDFLFPIKFVFKSKK